MRVIHFILLGTVLILCHTAHAQNAGKPLKYVHSTTNVTAFITEKTWNDLFPNRYNISNYANSERQLAQHTDFYSFQAFVAAAKKFPLFIGEGNKTTRKRELCAFLANIAQETSGGWDSAPGGYYKWGLYYVQERGCTNGCGGYTDTVNKNFLPVPGVSYHGRGPKQLSWNYNYGQFSMAYYGSKDTLLQHPEILTEDPVVSFASAIWFWMATQPPKPSCHNIMTGNWLPSTHDSLEGRLPGFGATVNVINGGVECSRVPAQKTIYRYEYYKYFCHYFHVSPGNNIECTDQKPFNQ